MIGDALIIYDPERGFLVEWRCGVRIPKTAIYTRNHTKALKYRDLACAHRAANDLNAQVISETKAKSIQELRWKHDA